MNIFKNTVNTVLNNYIHSKYPYAHTFIYTQDSTDWNFIKKYLPILNKNSKFKINDYEDMIEIRIPDFNNHSIIISKQHDFKDILNNYGNTSKFLIDETYYRNINVTTSHKNVKIF